MWFCPNDVQVEFLEFVFFCSCKKRYWTCELFSVIETLATCFLCNRYLNELSINDPWLLIEVVFEWICFGQHLSTFLPKRLTVMEWITLKVKNLLAEPRRMLQQLNAARPEMKKMKYPVSVQLLIMPEGKPTDNL